VKGPAVALCALLAACSSRGSDATAAGDAGRLPALFGSGEGSGGGTVELAPGHDAGELVDGSQVDAGDAAALDAGELVDGAQVDAGDAAALVDAGDPSTAGTFPGEHASQYGAGPFNAGAGCAPGFVNCDGDAANGCELAIGCPPAGEARCRDCAGTLDACVCSVTFTSGSLCGEHRCP
jgi:hypothetical protein